MKLNLGFVVAACFLVGSPSFALTVVEAEAVDSIERLKKPATISVKSPEDLRALIRGEQEKFALIAPPSLEPYWSSLNGDVFVEWEDWPEASRKLAFAVLDENMIPRYELKIWEDFVSAEIFVVNDRNGIMATLKPEKGFDPYGFWLKSRAGVSSISELSEFEQILYSSSHTALSLTLTPSIFEKACAEIREDERAVLRLAAVEESLIPMAMMSGGAVTNLQGAIGITTNGTVEIEVAWPSSFSNRVCLFSCEDLVAGDWSVLAEKLPTYSVSSLVFEDVASSNLTDCFYRAGDADLDSDGDFLVDSFELVVSRSLT
ncbi:MAG: hypothetical protein KAG97_00040, partial [Victivallales bacterium]|nr:hypothetical protein [Victivallales bacterium]